MILQELRKLRDYSELTNTERDNGICYFLLSRLGSQIASLGDVWKTWPKYSGNPVYPVPSPTGGDPKEEYNCNPDLWTGEYGELRKELLHYLIQELEK